MISAFERMAKSVLAVLGEDALFANSTQPCRINIEYGVQFIGTDAGSSSSQYRGEYTVARDVATVPESSSPREGMTFQFLDKTTGLPTGQRWRLEKFLDTNGYNKRYVVMKAP